MAAKKTKTTSRKKATRKTQTAKTATPKKENPGKPTGRRRVKKESASADDPQRLQTKVSKKVLDSAFSLAKSAGARKIFLYAEAFDDLDVLTQRKTDREVILISRDPELGKKLSRKRGPIKRIVTVAPVSLGRMGQIKMALVNALVAGAISQDELVVFVSGPSTPGSLDTIVLLDVTREFEMFAFDANPLLDKLSSPLVFQELLKIAVEIAHLGREGKPVGTIFVIGDHENVLRLSRQMIINPFKGYPDESCSIFKTEIQDTLREFAALDGAIVVRDDGVVVSAGRLLSITALKGSVPRGLGSRHAASAGITESTSAIAITVSETDGCVRIFKGGRVLTKIE